MNFIIFLVLVNIFHAQNPNNTYYSKNQGLPDQQFMESMKMYPDMLDALLKLGFGQESNLIENTKNFRSKT